jgi:hypothetical protein
VPFLSFYLPAAAVKHIHTQALIEDIEKAIKRMVETL